MHDMESLILRQRYEYLMEASADCLRRLKALGYTWDDSSSDFKIEEPAFPGKSQDADQTPIVLSPSSSSSSSSSEDDLPLSSRIKRAKVGITTEHTASMRSSNTASDTNQSRDSSGEDEREDRQQPCSVSRTAAFKKSEDQPTMHNLPSKNNNKPHDWPSPRVGLQKEQTKQTADQEPRAAPKRKLPEIVIDLEDDRDSNMEFKTAYTPSYKRTTMKKLQKTNPALAKAVQDRMQGRIARPQPIAKPNPQLQGGPKYGAPKAQVNTKATKLSDGRVEYVKANWNAAGKSFWSSLGMKGMTQTGKPQTAAAAPRSAVPKPSSDKGQDQGPPLKHNPTQSHLNETHVPKQTPAAQPRGSTKPSYLPKSVRRQPAQTKAAPPLSSAAQPAAGTAREQSAQDMQTVRPDSKNNQPAMHDIPLSADQRAEQLSSNHLDDHLDAEPQDGQPVVEKVIRGAQGELQATQDASHQRDECGMDQVVGLDEAAANEPLAGELDRDSIEDAEWRSRRKEIEKQALEARILKKRKRAEVELKTRAEERVNEYRLAAAAKEVAISEKDALRTTYRDGLKFRLKGRKTLRDILLALGCQVDGPDQGSVTKAYRRALLHFHPDRHVSSNLQAQIYAEEAFKIISEAAKA